MKTIFFMAFVIQGYWGLKDVRLRVPEAVKAGDSLSLGCDFSLEHEHLYSVKFYQGDTEFYRYVPVEDTPTMVFPIEGVSVDISRSNSSMVTLSGVTRGMTGYYKCEVSADAPLFHTGIQTAFVTVTEEPRGSPLISTEKLKYSLGEKIRANCTSEGGQPPANLTWFINGQQVQKSPYVRVSQEGGGESSRSTLEVVASPQVFLQGRMSLSCVASQFTLYRREVEVEVVEDTPQLAPVLGPTAHHQDPNSGKERSIQNLLFIIILQAYLVLWSER